MRGQCHSYYTKAHHAPLYSALLSQRAKEPSVISRNISWVPGMLKVNTSLLAGNTETPDAQGSLPEMDSLSRGGQNTGISAPPRILDKS